MDTATTSRSGAPPERIPHPTNPFLSLEPEPVSADLEPVKPSQQDQVKLAPDLLLGTEPNIPSSSTNTSAPITPTPSPEAGKGQWKLKDIGLWPDLRAGGLFRRNVKILVQNANGPCSLLALANCLLLRGSIHISSKTTSITYDQLSLLIADFLVTRPNPNSSFTLESALSILPTMTQGLDVDIEFNSISSFRGISDRQSGELSVFQYAGVDLVHGWLADPAKGEEFEALQRAGSYEGAQLVMVRGMEAGTKGLSVDGTTAFDLSDEDQELADDSKLLQQFLRSSSSQLTYPGLFALSALEPGSIVALFRNSHLSVLYRRYDPDPNSSSDGPLLFSLVTDSAFRNEREVTWESIVDVDGSGSSFYDSDFRPSGAAGGDFVGMDPRAVARNAARVEALSLSGQGGTGHDDTADRQLAAALQNEEDERIARSYDLQERTGRTQDNVKLSIIQSLIGLPASSPRLSSVIATIAGPSTVMKPEVKAYPDVIYHNYYKLGVSLCFIPLTGTKFKKDPKKDDLKLDSIDIYNVPAEVQSRPPEKKAFSTPSKTTFSTFPLFPILIPSSTSEPEFSLITTSTGKDIVTHLQEPAKKGGGKLWLDVWFEYPQLGIQVELKDWGIGGNGPDSGGGVWDRAATWRWSCLKVFKKDSSKEKNPKSGDKVKEKDAGKDKKDCTIM